MRARAALGASLQLLLVTGTECFVRPNVSLSRHAPASYQPSSTQRSLMELAPWVTPHDFGAAESSVKAIVSMNTPPLLTFLWESYSSLLRENPVETKTTTAAILCFTGDAVAQFQSSSVSGSHDSGKNAFTYDPRRGLAFLAFGALYTGCFQHHWFEFLNTNVVDWGETLRIWGHPAETNIPLSHFVGKDEWWQYFDVVSQIQDVMSQLQDPPTRAALAATKVALNQFAVIPVVYMPLFFAVSGALGGLDASKSIARAQSLYVPLLQRNYLFWLPVQFFQFYALPTEYQIPFVCVASFCWTIILSTIGGSTTPSETPVVYETVTVSNPVVLPGSSTAEVQQPIDLQQQDEEVVTVVRMDAGAVNELTDTVTLEDVQDALVPRTVRDAVDTVGEAVEDALAKPKVGSSARGLAFGLLASAADEGAIGSAVAYLLGGVGTNVGVAVVTAIGAGLGFLAADANTGDDISRQESLEEGPKTDDQSTFLQDGTAMSEDMELVFTSQTSGFEAMNSTVTLAAR